MGCEHEYVKTEYGYCCSDSNDSEVRISIIICSDCEKVIAIIPV